MKYTLAIVIPTRNRIENLTKLLIRLDEASGEFIHRIKLIVYDNFSSEYSFEELNGVISNNYTGIYEIITSNVNIGGDANILKSFQNSEAEWIFPIGDSKMLGLNSINTIFELIEKNKSSNFINFFYPDKTHGQRLHTIECSSETEFIAAIESLGNILLLGNTIYKTENVPKVIKYGYQHIYSCAGQTAIMIKLANYGGAILSNKIIIDKMMEKPTNTELNMPLDYWIKIPSLIHCLDKHEDRMKFKRIIAGIGYPTPDMWWLIYSTILEASSGDKEEILSKYKMGIVSRFNNVSLLRTILFYHLPTVFLLIPFNEKILILLKKIKRKFI